MKRFLTGLLLAAPFFLIAAAGTIHAEEENVEAARARLNHSYEQSRQEAIERSILTAKEREDNEKRHIILCVGGIVIGVGCLWIIRNFHRRGRRPPPWDSKTSKDALRQKQIKSAWIFTGLWAFFVIITLNTYDDSSGKLSRILFWALVFGVLGLIRHIFID